MQREARFILPTRFNDGQIIPADLINQSLEEVVNEFGGVTIANAYGYWKRPDDGKIVAESVYTFDVAMPEGREKEQALIALATKAAIRLNQHSVYVRLPGGEVIIPEVQKHAVADDIAA